jgi:hypothetical protein
MARFAGSAESSWVELKLKGNISQYLPPSNMVQATEVAVITYFTLLANWADG